MFFAINSGLTIPRDIFLILRGIKDKNSFRHPPTLTSSQLRFTTPCLAFSGGGGSQLFPPSVSTPAGKSCKGRVTQSLLSRSSTVFPEFPSPHALSENFYRTVEPQFSKPKFLSLRSWGEFRRSTSLRSQKFSSHFRRTDFSGEKKNFPKTIRRKRRCRRRERAFENVPHHKGVELAPRSPLPRRGAREREKRRRLARCRRGEGFGGGGSVHCERRDRQH